jgi:hypothetical protein
MAGRTSGDLQKIKDERDVSVNASDARHPTWGYVCTQTFRCFRAQFQYYFPPVLLAGAFVYLCNYGLQWASDKLVVRPSFESIMEPARFTIQRFVYAVGRVSIWSIQLWVVWLVFTFVLATFAVKMLHERHPAGNPMRIGEAFRLVRSRRQGSLVGISALAGAATGLFSIFLMPLLLRPLPLLLMQLHLVDDLDNYRLAFTWTSAALILMFAALLTKMALAVPELVDDPDVSVGGSIRNSIKATAGWELFFVLMFAIVGLAGGILYTAGSDFLEHSWKHGQLSSAGYGMLLAAFTAVVAALVITLVAITYSVLYMAVRYGRFETVSETAESPD